MTPLNPELTELSLERLRQRRSAKWAKYPAEVLPAWVTEMDFPLAAPVKRALLEAVELGDCGYAHPEDVAWLNVRALNLGPDPSQPLLERDRVALSPGPLFGPQGTGFARLNLGTSPALVEEAVARIGGAVG